MCIPAGLARRLPGHHDVAGRPGVVGDARLVPVAVDLPEEAHGGCVRDRQGGAVRGGEVAPVPEPPVTGVADLAVRVPAEPDVGRRSAFVDRRSNAERPEAGMRAPEKVQVNQPPTVPEPRACSTGKPVFIYKPFYLYLDQLEVLIDQYYESYPGVEITDGW